MKRAKPNCMTAEIYKYLLMLIGLMYLLSTNDNKMLGNKLKFSNNIKVYLSIPALMSSIGRALIKYIIPWFIKNSVIPCLKRLYWGITKCL
jgi:hypothetical protein